MTSFFRNYSPGTLWRSLALLAALIFTFWVSTPLPAVAQQTFVTGPSTAQTVSTPAPNNNSVALPGVTVSTTQPPAPTPTGITTTGWNASSIIGQGYTVGGDGKGTTTTLADGIFKLGVEANLAANSQGSCRVDCQYTLSKVTLIGEQISGARSVNQGLGTQSAPVTSVAGTHGMFTSSAQIKWIYTPPPAAPSGN